MRTAAALLLLPLLAAGPALAAAPPTAALLPASALGPGWRSQSPGTFEPDKLDDYCARDLLPGGTDRAAGSNTRGVFGPYVTQVVARFPTPAAARRAVARAGAVTAACARWTGATPNGTKVRWVTVRVPAPRGVPAGAVVARGRSLPGRAIPTEITYAVMARGRLAEVVQVIVVNARDPALARTAISAAAARLPAR